ncbi:probable aspartic protease At2g35615 [Lotus japonicus]|uniref:probable aspartic protease At2g35615 n=1 Tax=Lotus japonicus TaxID=34305 RepID=UPI002586CFBA|nr:probable aspartic protease At2g35615 [Lotus japonicus]
MHALAFFFAASCSLLATLPFTEPSKTQSSFTIDLIHHDSSLSPFYNSSMTRSQLIRNAAMRSISRANRLSFSHTLNKLKESPPEAIIIPNNGDYLMRIYIGTPSVERLAIADTGSDLTWVQCSSCDITKCFAQNTSFYDPKHSSTFAFFPCDSETCTQLPYSQYICGDSGECIYGYNYGDESYSYGGFGSDSISFDATAATPPNFPKFVFGCGYVNKITADKSRKPTGIVGLGAGPLSLVSQLGDEIGHKFSYCLLPFASNSSSKLKFGEAAIVQGNGVVSTPLIIKPDLPFYYLNLEGITVGAKTVKTGQTDGNIIIDSRSTLTYLEKNLYNEFVSLVKEIVAVEEENNYGPYPFDFCFTYKEGMSAPPDVVFHFTGGDVVLKPMHTLLLIEDNLTCSTVVPSSFGGISIFGNLAQIDFHVGYDIQGGKVSFAPTNCSLN